MKAGWLLRVLFMVCCATSWTACDSAPSASVPDRLVVILIDTLRARRLAFHGCSKDNMPFLNSLAERSWVFENTWATSSWTAPSTASIFTSLYPLQHGVVTGLLAHQSLQQGHSAVRLNGLPAERPVLPEVLQEAGYTTFGLSANLNIDSAEGFDRGFDVFRCIPDGTAEELSEVLRSWREDYLSAEKAFLYLHWFDPHSPYHVREGFQVRPATDKALQKYWQQNPPQEDPPALDPFHLVGELRHENPPLSQAQTMEVVLAAYDSELRYLDRHLREVWDFLQLEQAVVILSSDHGEEFGDHGGVGHPFQLYSELLQVPLLVHGADWPGGPTVVDTTASTLDLLPTLRQLAGLPGSPFDEGLDLLQLLPGQDAVERTLFASRTLEVEPRKEELRATVSGRYHWIQSLQDGNVELFDVVADPKEKHDLSAERPELCRQLQQQRQEFEDNAPRCRRLFVEDYRPDAETNALLRRLGYVADDP